MIYIKRNDTNTFVVSVRSTSSLVSINVASDINYINTDFILQIEQLSNPNTVYNDVYDSNILTYTSYYQQITNISNNVNYLTFILSYFIDESENIKTIDELDLGQYKYKIYYVLDSNNTVIVDEGIFLVDEVNLVLVDEANLDRVTLPLSNQNVINTNTVETTTISKDTIHNIYK